MKFFTVIPYYLYWHYSRGLVEWTRNLFNFLAFEFHFFSVQELLRTLFAPFQRLTESYGNSPVDVETIFSALIVNTIMRVVGLVVRSFILCIAAVSITLSFVLVLTLLVAWILLPLILIVLVIGGALSFLTSKP